MKVFILIAALLLIAGNADIVSAQSDSVYKPLVEIPGLDADSQSTGEYVEALYILSITVAAFLAVVKIIFGGVKWMLSDVVTDKSAAKKDIWGAIIGLLIVLSAVLILNTINPNLTQLDFLQNADPIGVTLKKQPPSYPTVKIGDFHGMWCGNIFTIVCSKESEESLEFFKKSCKEDAGGIIQTRFLDGYLCVEDQQKLVNSLQDSGEIITTDESQNAREVFDDIKAQAIASDKEVVYESQGPYDTQRFRQSRIIECAELGATGYSIVTPYSGGSEMILCYK